MKQMFLMGFLLLFCLLSLFGEEEKPAVQEEKKIAVPVILNLIPGFGIGSFTQGDTLGGVICLVGDLAGGGLIAFGVYGSFAYIAEKTVFFGLFGMDWDFEMAQKVIATGMVIFLISKTFGIIRPIWYGISYNRRLREERVTIFPGIRYPVHTGDTGPIPVIWISVRLY